MIYNTGWGNLIPQKLKYTPALAAKAAKLLQSGESLTATARSLNISRASLRNWRQRDPALNRAFETFESNKAKAEAKRKRIKHFKEVAAEIVDAAREEAADPVETGVKAHQEAKAIKVEKRPVSPKEAYQRRLQEHWVSAGLPDLRRNKHKWRKSKCSRKLNEDVASGAVSFSLLPNLVLQPTSSIDAIIRYPFPLSPNKIQATQ